MKIALVHDYIKEYGGAERVLETLSEMFPEAPIYTAFCVKNSTAGRIFKDKKIITSWANRILQFKNLYSPLRFLTPFIWGSFNFKDYDLVITSASWYITKGVNVPKGTLNICYCHTPPRWLYGYQTSLEWRRYWPVRIYGEIVAHFLRLYDFVSAQKVDAFIANSKNTQSRIKKFYRKDSKIIYPPIEVEKIIKATKDLKAKDYLLVASRVVGAKGIDMAIEAANRLNLPLKIIGESAGLRWEKDKLDKLKGKTVEFLGRVSDEELYKYYGECRAFLALAQDEDFGMTPVEAMAAGRPVVAYKGGGYLESVVDSSTSSGQGATGVFFTDYSVEGLTEILKNLKIEKYKPEDCREQAKKFSKERFKMEIVSFIDSHRK